MKLDLKINNHHTRNAAIARTYVEAMQLKGWFMAKAQQIAILVSALMMSTGILLQYTGVKLVPSWDTLLRLVAAGPVAVIVIVFAILVEGMTIITSNGVVEARNSTEKKIRALEEAKKKHPKGMTEEEFEKRKTAIERETWLPQALLLLFCGFSFLGGELFWHSLLEGTNDIFIQIIGYVLGGCVCLSLIYLETHAELVNDGIERSISSSHLIYRAMDMDARGQILEELSEERSKKLHTREFRMVIEETAIQSLFAPLAETLQNMGDDSMDAAKLRGFVDGIIQEKQAVNALVSGMQRAEKNTDEIPVVDAGKLRKQYKTEQARKCKEHIQKYGRSVVGNDIEKHAEMVGVSENTLRKYLG